MDIHTDKKGWTKFQCDAVVIGVFEPNPEMLLNELSRELGPAIAPVLKRKEITGEFGRTKLLNTFGKIPAEHVLLVGCGKRESFDTEMLRRVSGIAARTLRAHSITCFATALHHLPAKGASVREKAQAVAEGIVLADYRFTKYKTKDREKLKQIRSAVLLEADRPAETGAREGRIIADAQNRTRDLVNEPSIELTPAKLAEYALSLRKLGVKVTVFNSQQMKKLGLNAVLAVGAGSRQEPKFIVLELHNKKGAPLAVCGKGITFDAGGLNVKPSSFIEGMNTDMAGAAAVIGAFKAAAELKLPVNIVGIIPAAENLLGGSAFKPGDIIRAFNGSTIDVGNTDAEGRVVLADAVSYAEKNFRPKAIIDIATLTGSCVSALGYFAAGIMGTDSGLISKIRSAGDSCGERVWELPMWDDYKSIVKSEVADVRNVPGGKGYEAGAIAGAMFLSHFVDRTPWVHIDIAGPSRNINKTAYATKGGTGWGVRLLVRLFQNW